MKRHQVLVPLSREHHQQLLLARLLRDDAPPYKGLPTEKEEKLTYAVKRYQQLILDHFRKEEVLFQSISDFADEELTGLISDQRKFQKEIKNSFDTIKTSSLDQIGRLLENAIRHEERKLYQSIQAKINLDKLDISF